MSRWNQLKVALDSSSSRNQITPKTATMQPPITAVIIAMIRGWKVHNGVTGSDPAGVDVGGEDRPGTDLPELVHDALCFGPGHHHADGDPAFPMKG